MVTSGMNVVLEAGVPGFITVAVSDQDPGDEPTLHIAPLNDTECMTIVNNSRVEINATDLEMCNIA